MFSLCLCNSVVQSLRKGRVIVQNQFLVLCSFFLLLIVFIIIIKLLRSYCIGHIGSRRLKETAWFSVTSIGIKWSFKFCWFTGHLFSYIIERDREKERFTCNCSSLFAVTPPRNEESRVALCKFFFFLFSSFFICVFYLFLMSSPVSDI